MFFKLLEIYKNIKEKLPQFEIYYKPHPSEEKDFNDLELINTINTQKEYLEVLSKTSFNIGIFGSVMYYPLLLGKNIVIIDFTLSGINDELDMEASKDPVPPVIRIVLFLKGLFIFNIIYYSFTCFFIIKFIKILKYFRII